MAPNDAGTSQSHERSHAHSFDEDTAFSPWLLLWTILVVKIVTLATIVIVGHSGGAALIAVTSIPWLFAVVALSIGPLLFRARLRRVRARREELRRQEWMESSDSRSAADPAFHVKHE